MQNVHRLLMMSMTMLNFSSSPPCLTFLQVFSKFVKIVTPADNCLCLNLCIVLRSAKQTVNNLAQKKLRFYYIKA